MKMLERPEQGPEMCQSPWGRVGSVEMTWTGPAGRRRQPSEATEGGSAKGEGGGLFRHRPRDCLVTVRFSRGTLPKGSGFPESSS